MSTAKTIKHWLPEEEKLYNGGMKAMRWMEVSAAVSKDSLESLKAILEKYGQGGATIEEIPADDSGGVSYQVKAYLPYSRRYAEIKREIESKLEPWHLKLVERSLKPEDWFAPLKDHFHPVEIGKRLVIKPSWVDMPSLKDRVIIELDPGTAFGTGLHPTTRLCLQQIEQNLRQGMKVFDLGTGTGILAIAAAKLGAASVLAVDIDPVAVKAAKNNIVSNSVDKIVQVKRGTLSLRKQKELQEGLDMVLANISAGIISNLSSGFWKILRNGGIFIGTGIHFQQLDEVLIKLAMNGFQFITVESEEEWRVIVARKPGNGQ